MREKFLKNLIAGVYKNREEITEKFRSLNLPFKGDETMIAAVVQIDSGDTVVENTVQAGREESKSRYKLSISIEDIVNKIVSNYGPGISFGANENEFVVLLCVKSNTDNRHMEVCKEIMKLVKKYTGASVSNGVGRAANGPDQVFQSYRGAVAALKYKFHTDRNSLLNIDDIGVERDPSIYYSDLYDSEMQLIRFMKSGDIDGVSETIDGIFDFFCTNSGFSAGCIQSVCIGLLTAACKSIYEVEENAHLISGDMRELLEETYEKKTALELQDYVISVFKNFTEFFSGRNLHKNAQIVKKIKKIIHTSYMEKISTAMISEEVYLSPNYISTVFKQVTGETITDYIAEVRIENAKNMLKTTELKILEVAEKVGYDSPHYFSTVFKKYTGLNPLQYRLISREHM